MKKKIGEIYNKPIVIGDKNLMTKNEVHKDEISGSSKEYDDLNTFLYYDDRIVSIEGAELPLCGLVGSTLFQLASIYPHSQVIIKLDNTKDVLGVNFGNYIPVGALSMGSGYDYESVFLLSKGISIPKYVFPEYLTSASGVPIETDKFHIFDFIGLVLSPELGDFLKTQPTITREEFFDLLK